MTCCDCGAPAPGTDRAQRAVLWAVLAINVSIFVCEFGAGVWARSTALQSDSLDSLGDAIVYGVSLAVVGASLRTRAKTALFKGCVQLAFAALVLTEVVYALIQGPAPVTRLMAFAAAGALVANGVCMALLARFRNHDLNMRSVWLCSRNDVISNAAVLLTTGLIAATSWDWLDPLFGGAIALLFAVTGARVIAASLAELRRSTPPTASSFRAPCRIRCPIVSSRQTLPVSRP